jgi:hypothetical protein
VVKDEKKGIKHAYMWGLSTKLKSPIKILFVSRVILLHETLEFKHVIALYYEK